MEIYFVKEKKMRILGKRRLLFSLTKCQHKQFGNIVVGIKA
jgi:hypothetical protein